MTNLWKENITSTDELRSVLSAWFTIIEWWVDISSQNISSLSEFAKFNYEVTMGFNCSNNKLTSFEWFPKKVSFFLDCSNNKIETLENIPYPLWSYNGQYIDIFIENNNFKIVEEIIPNFLYKYWPYYLQKDDKDNTFFMESINKVLWVNPENSSNLEEYERNLKRIIKTNTTHITFKKNFVNIWWRLFSKDIFIKGMSQLYSIEHFEVESLDKNITNSALASNKVVFKWKIYNRKQIKSLK